MWSFGFYPIGWLIVSVAMGRGIVIAMIHIILLMTLPDVRYADWGEA